jgi:hypothetical protein
MLDAPVAEARGSLVLPIMPLPDCGTDPVRDAGQIRALDAVAPRRSGV